LKIKQKFHQSQRRKRLKGKKKISSINKKRKMGVNINVNNFEIKYFFTNCPPIKMEKEVGKLGSNFVSRYDVLKHINIKF
jgi:hypothetical protein